MVGVGLFLYCILHVYIYGYILVVNYPCIGIWRGGGDLRLSILIHPAAHGCNCASGTLILFGKGEPFTKREPHSRRSNQGKIMKERIKWNIFPWFRRMWRAWV